MDQIQWFPGHMAKARRKLIEDLKFVDIVAELVDARIPQSSMNPVLRQIIQGKPKITLLNKSDLADPKENEKWLTAYRKRGEVSILTNGKSGKGLSELYPAIQAKLEDQIQRWKERGMSGRPIRMMVIGIPNVGKSSLINRLLSVEKSAKAEVRDKPGVTRQNRWFTVKKGFELLDTPGVLWPKFEDPQAGRLLAYTGAVKDEILDLESLAFLFLEHIMPLYPRAISDRYHIDLPPVEDSTGEIILERIGKKRGMLLPGGKVNYERAAITVLDEFRRGLIGRMTLEQVSECE